MKINISIILVKKSLSNTL